MWAVSVWFAEEQLHAEMAALQTSLQMEKAAFECELEEAEAKQRKLLEARYHEVVSMHLMDKKQTW
jgi:hypothetical protein